MDKLFIALLFGGVAAIAISIGADSIIGIILGIGLIVLAFIILKMCIKTDNTTRVVLDEYISTSLNDRVTIRKRSPVLAENIDIQRFTYHEKDYHNAEVVYTGVTRGGVHMGGFHVNPETQSNGRLVKTDKYDLILRGYGKKLSELILVGDVLENAKNNPFISQFLKGDTLVLSHQVHASELERNTLLNPTFSTGSTLSTATFQENLAGEYVTKTKLTHDECTKIRNWLGGQ